MKRRSACRCTMGMAATIWRICGNTGSRMGRWCSTSAWGVGAKARNIFWGISMVFCKAMDMPFTIPWAGRRWCTRAVGHARRKFVEAVKLHPQDAQAVRMVRLIDELFAIDAEARAANLDHAARHVLRSKKAPALLEEIKAAVTAARATSLPASALAKAANYTLALWPKLTRFLE